METITYKAIKPQTFGGSYNGATYRYEIKEGELITLATNARDVAAAYRWAGQPIPAELQGPYDGLGNQI
jgi:hypothetical protein